MRENRLPDDQSLIDRLVDGEIDAVERRALLARLEHQPDGWRRCALAFLEAQSWREALSPQLNGAANASVRNFASSSVSLARAERAEGSGRWRRWSTLAAACLVAFSLGWLTSGRASIVRSGSSDRNRVVAIAPSLTQEAGVKTSESDLPRTSGSASPASVTTHTEKKVGALETSPTAQLPTASVATTAESPARSSPNHAVTLSAFPRIDRHALPSMSELVSESVHKTFERQGMHVETQRGLLSVPLMGGRHLTVPVNAVKVRPISRQIL
jgi:hypothetical protein